MHLILIGAPGSGKGTQAKLLIEHFGLDHISTGDMLRAAVSEDSALGRQVKEILEAGRLVSDELVAQLVEQRLERNQIDNGFIMDGYPRTESQSGTFDQSLRRLGLSLDAVIGEHQSNVWVGTKLGFGYSSRVISDFVVYSHHHHVADELVRGGPCISMALYFLLAN